MAVDKKIWQNQRVYITGHTGFKGAWLSRWLIKMGAEVRGYALAPPTEPNLFDQLKLDQALDHVIGDIRHFADMDASIKAFRPDVIFHLAAQSLVRSSYDDPVLTYDTNLMGTVNLLESVKNLADPCAVIIVTTDKVYENLETDKPYSEDDRLAGFDPYSSSKACAELATSSYRQSFFSEPGSSKIATVRAGNVIGGGDWALDRLVPDLVRSLIGEDVLTIRNPGAIRPWQHVLDPLAGYLLVAQGLLENLSENQPAVDRSWNFGPDASSERTVGEVASLMLKSWGGKQDWKTPNSIQPHEAGILKLNSELAKQKLGWHPCLAFEQVVELTTTWYKNVAAGADAATITDDQLDGYINILFSGGS